MFVRGLAEGLGLDPQQVTSPTFVICHEYDRSTRAGSAGPALIHIDAYRIRSAEDLETIGWADLLDAPGTILAIEWPSRIINEVNRVDVDRKIDVSIAHLGEHSRAISMVGPDDLMEDLRSLEAACIALKASAMQRNPAGQCRTCGRGVASDAPEFPFCSARCRLAELNKWFSESYRVSRPAEEDEELDE